MTADKLLRLGDVLLMRGLVAVEDLEAALDRQREQGGPLGESVVALGLLSPEQLQAVLRDVPALPFTVGATGVSRSALLGLLLKFMRMEGCETLPELGSRMKLHQSVLQELLAEATTQHLVQALGSVQQGLVSYMRYSLTDQGRVAAAEAMAQSQYLGPAPVSLAAFQAQVGRQAIANENLVEDVMRRGFAGLSMPANFVRKLLPAVRAGRTVLLYGPPGNGKTSVGSRIADMFRDVIHVPYAIEVSGQVIKMFDDTLHKPYGREMSTPALSSGEGLLLESFDARWQACRRPVAMAGGELTLEMLDLGFDAGTKFYEAPLHMKALNGVLLIDDFGRQRVSPTELLNRWIVPMESRIDYLKLNSGMSFQIPFDELVIFSTNLDPSDLVDPAFLRRIPYKVEVAGPSAEEYRQVFAAAATQRGLAIEGGTLDHIVQRLEEGGHDLAYFQPRFVCEQAFQLCACFSLPPVITREVADEGLENLYVDLIARKAR